MSSPGSQRLRHRWQALAPGILEVEGRGQGQAQITHPQQSTQPPLQCPISVRNPRASSAKTRGFHTQLDEGPETP